MSWRARGKTKIINSKANTGKKSGVVSKVGFGGRGRVIRGALMGRSVCVTDTCYNSIGMMTVMKKN